MAKKKEPKITEDYIQKGIVKYLRNRGYIVFSTPNEASGNNLKRLNHFISMGLMPGVADLTVWFPWNITYLEVKTKKGRQSDNQKHFEQLCKRYGYDYFVVRSIEDVKNIMEMKKNE